MQMNHLNRFFLFLAFTCSFLFAYTQTELPLNPKVKIGKLENGLTYYILPNKKPESKVELRLVLNAGSINEDDDQQGLAHMTEHMAFNGTTHFKKNEIISFLQDIGVGFGNDLNAYTGFDETVYILPIPTSKPENLEKGFKVLEDWASNITFNNDDIDAERNVILEESRLGKGAVDRMYRSLDAVLYKGSMYGKRLPIGIDSIIQHFKHDAIKRYYRDWYRPNLMAVIVVGDITVEKAEEYIKNHFSNLKNPVQARERKVETANTFAQSEVVILKDKEATNYAINVHYSHIKRTIPANTEAGYKAHLTNKLFTAIFNQRLQELTQKPNPPIIYAAVDLGSYARGYNAFSVYSYAGNKTTTNAIEAIVTEIERAKQFGFTKDELERAKKNTISGLEKAFNNRDKTESSAFVEELIRYFLEKEPMPGIENEFEMSKRMLEEIQIDDVNQVLNLIKNQDHKVIAVMGPESDSAVVPSDSAKIARLVEQFESAEIKPYEEKQVSTQLLKSVPKKGKVISKIKNAALGTTDLILSNGIKVTLKKTDFKDDEIVLSASRLGGSGKYGVADRYTTSFLNEMIAAMGFGDFTPVDLKKSLAGKNANLATSFSTYKEGFSGNSSVKDLETMLQLLYLRVTEPRNDTALFNSFIQKQKDQYAMLAANPEYYFVDSFYDVLYNNNPLAPFLVPRISDIEKINLKRGMEIYKSHFGNMQGMQFAFVGNVDEKTIIPLLETYLASLPSKPTKSGIVDNKVRAIKGKKNFTVYKGIEEKSFVIASFAGEYPYNEDLALKADALNEVLNIRIIEELREKIQGIYGGGIFGNFAKYPTGNYSYFVQLPCGPEKIDTLITALFNEIKTVRNKGIEESYLNKVKLQWKESHKESIKSNAEWASRLIGSKVDGKNIQRFTKFNSIVDKITIADIKQAATIFLNNQNVIIGKLMPEKYKQ